MKTYGIYVNSDENLKEQFGSSNLHIVKGFDTRGGKWENFSEKICPIASSKLKKSIEMQKREFHHDLTEGAVGCFLSHIHVYKTFLKETNEKYIFVVEEDTVHHPYLSFNFDDSKYPKNFDMIFLNYNLREKYKYNEHYYGLRPNGIFWMTNAYIISRKGAMKIVRRCFEKDKMKMQFDSYLSFLHQQGYLSLFFTNFRYFPQKESHQTTIQTTEILNPHNFVLCNI